jgi:hypothetical protein
MVWSPLARIRAIAAALRKAPLGTPSPYAIPGQRTVSHSAHRWSSHSDSPNFPGAVKSKYTSKLDFVDRDHVIPTYRVLDKDGKVVSGAKLPNLTQDWATKVYKDMVTLNTMDMIMYEAQRQGRISFYMTNYGEEATHMGSAAGLHPDDVVFGQVRILLTPLSSCSEHLPWKGYLSSSFLIILWDLNYV